MACQLKSKEEVINFCQENRVKFIRLWFTDVLGSLKSFAIPIEELENALQEGMGFDGSSIKGFARIDESDMIALPDPTTFQILPWRSGEEKVGRMFCDVLNPDGSPYDGDPRYILKRNLERLKEKGFSFYLGPELEFFYFKNDKEPLPLDQGGYFDLTTLDAASDLRRDTIRTLEEMGIRVEYSHHEVAFSQHEIDLRYADALMMADQVMTYRIVVKEIAQKYGVYATFMPKPVMGINGSGMHTHQSLFQGDKNAFFDAQDPYFLSDVAKKYIAGILGHAKEIALVTNQWVNSYKRLVPGYEAPVYICWARRNRSALVRVPMYKPGKEKATRIEMRNPDPACNPYLAFSAMLTAGLAGIEGNYELPEPIEKDVYHMSQEERERLKIDSLPGNLKEAIDFASQSKILRESLGDHIFDFLIQSKLVEWDEYRIIVHPYEIEKYLPIL
ncbi:MAG: glutamine synthetase [Candidatus Atribacteria bacterium]|nr:glutamine synthetase [Candidatus Atribacteria bacterium]